MCGFQNESENFQNNSYVQNESVYDDNMSSVSNYASCNDDTKSHVSNNPFLSDGDVLINYNNSNIFNSNNNVMKSHTMHQVDSTAQSHVPSTPAVPVCHPNSSSRSSLNPFSPSFITNAPQRSHQPSRLRPVGSSPALQNVRPQNPPVNALPYSANHPVSSPPVISTSSSTTCVNPVSSVSVFNNFTTQTQVNTSTSDNYPVSNVISPLQFPM